MAGISLAVSRNSAELVRMGSVMNAWVDEYFFDNGFVFFGGYMFFLRV